MMRQGLVGELVPCLAAVGDDVVTGVEDPAESQFCRMNCRTFSTGFSSGERSGSGRSVMFSGTTSRPDTCQPAWSRTSTACAPGGRADLGEVRLHRLGICEGHDECRALAELQADRAEDVGPSSGRCGPYLGTGVSGILCAG
jgi:hypothetical protein